MASKNINIMTNVVLPIVVYVATIGLFLLLMPAETTPLYWINMSYLVVLETVFFGWLVWVRADAREVTPMLAVIMGTYAAYYVAAGLICIIASAVVSLFTVVSVKWYIAAIVVLTVLWLIPAALIAQADSNHAERQAQVQDKREELLRRSEERKRAQLGNDESTK